MKRSTKTISIILIFFLIIATVIIGRSMIGNHFKKKFSKRPPPGIIVTEVIEKEFSEKFKRANITYEHSSYTSGYRYKGTPLGAFIDGDSNYAHISFNGEINNFTNLEFSVLYGNLNKDKSGNKNSWGINNEDFFGIVFIFDFKISPKIEAGLNFISLSEELTYRGRILEKNIVGLDFKYRF